MAKKKIKNKKPSQKHKRYKIVNDKIEREKYCPRCGAGIFLGIHKDRLYCGKCHYVEMKK